MVTDRNRLDWSANHFFLSPLLPVISYSTEEHYDVQHMGHPFDSYSKEWEKN